MKKTISSSIGGIVFNVEEDAHAKLSAYIDAISASLKDSEGHDEIMADIESRIAEIFQQKLSNYKQVVTLTEVDEVISIMGDPEDFGAPAGTQTKQQDYNTSGNQYGYSGRRRVYRDTDDKVISGVCSGLAHHFGVDPIWLRLAFGLSIFIGGFGIILYILLIVITPKARTAAEKLEMMGEPVDVNNIRKKMEEEMDNFKKKVKDFGNDFKSGRTGDRAKDFGKDMGDFFASSGQGVGHVLGGIIKTILIAISIFVSVIIGIVLIALIISVTSGVHIQTGNHHEIFYSAHSLFDMLAVTGAMRDTLVIGILLFLGIPLLALIMRFSRVAAGRRQPFQWFTITAGILWSISWVLMIIGIAGVFSHFSVNGFTRSDVKVNPSIPAKMLYVKMDNKVFADNNFEGISVGNNAFELDSLNVYISDESELRQNPSLCIEQSPDSNYHLIVTKIARGVSKAEADEYIDGIDYSYVNRDSTLVLDPYFTIELTKGWRKQKLDLSLEVPLNKSVDLPEGIDHILCKAMHHKGQHIGGSKWTMSQAGLVAFSN